jgi:hypothetical protein
MSEEESNYFDHPAQPEAAAVLFFALCEFSMPPASSSSKSSSASLCDAALTLFLDNQLDHDQPADLRISKNTNE